MLSVRIVDDDDNDDDADHHDNKRRSDVHYADTAQIDAAMQECGT